MRTDEDKPFALDCAREGRILSQEAITGVKRSGAARLTSGYDFFE